MVAHILQDQKESLADASIDLDQGSHDCMNQSLVLEEQGLLETGTPEEVEAGQRNVAWETGKEAVLGFVAAAEEYLAAPSSR